MKIRRDLQYVCKINIKLKFATKIIIVAVYINNLHVLI